MTYNGKLKYNLVGKHILKSILTLCCKLLIVLHYLQIKNLKQNWMYYKPIPPAITKSLTTFNSHEQLEV